MGRSGTKTELKPPGLFFLEKFLDEHGEVDFTSEYFDIKSLQILSDCPIDG